MKLYSPLRFCLLFALLHLLASQLLAQSIQPLDLKPFVGLSPFDTIGASWLPQRGLQVIDGTPFQIDGVIIMYGNYQSQRTRPGRTNVNGIVVGRAFETLHLFAGAQAVTASGTALAKVHLQYADGASNTLDILYGAHVRNWFGPWHQPETPPPDPAVGEVWRFLFSAAATTDKYLRMYHVVLTNPEPTRVVRTLAIESLKKPSGLMIAGMSVGPLAAERQKDTIPELQSPFPDLRPRSGEKVSGSGIVKRITGEPLPGARVRVVKVRTFAENYNQGTENDEAVGVEAITGEDGRFTLPPLRDDRMYNLLAFADGYETAPFGGADVKSDPIELRLKPLGEITEFSVRGRVIGPDDRPVASALIEPHSVDIDGNRTTGLTTGFQEQNFSDSKGEFTLSRRESFSRLRVRIKASGLATEMVWLPVTNAVQTIRLGVGSTVRGRLVKDAMPVANVEVGICDSDRSYDVFAGYFQTRTDANGVFVFTNLPSVRAWYVYGIVGTLPDGGALSPQMAKGGANGSVEDLGDLIVKPGLRLAGTIKTRTGEPLPDDIKIRIGNDKAWNSHASAPDREGKFEINGLYTGGLNLSVEPRDWKLSADNRSLDLLNGWRMTGLLEGDKEDLLLIVEKGRFDYSSSSVANGQLPAADRPENRPLFGAEKSGPRPIVLAGQVLDDKTGSPVGSYRILPGYKPPVNTALAPPAQKPLLQTILSPFTKKPVPPGEQPYWMFGRIATNTQADFAIEFVPLSSAPLLRFEADEYLPFETDPSSATTSNLVIRLKRGSGPDGVVLLPDGKPAEGATVVYAIAKEQFGFADRKLSTYNRGKEFVTGKDGKFSFPMRAHARTLFVAHQAGWAEKSVEEGGENLKLKLQPWAVLSGTLVDTNNQLMVGVELGLTMPHDWQAGDPFMNFQARVKTDVQGRFQFVNVPPRRLEVQRIIPVGPPPGVAGLPPNRGWSYRMQTWLVAQPGTNDLGNVTYDQPPRAPLFEQIKKSIGL
ncbi:MAG TPA: hypothetical protein VFZ59_14505 [Verrucomicrobiae bacterium]|nr:hypothetical protein [Verrucomicrobiae bacterium]